MKKRNFALIFIVIFFIAILMINPIKYSASFIEGLKLYRLHVLPTLFPFMFFSKLLNELGLSRFVAKHAYKPVNKVYHSSGFSAYVMMMGIICGYPVSSKILADITIENNLDKNEVIPISSFSSNSNPLFIIGTIGGFMLQNTTFATIILICHYISSILNGLIFSTFRLPRKKAVKPNFIQTEPTGYLEKTINSTIIAVLAVGGYICLFYMLSDILIDYKIIDGLSYVLSKIFGVIRIPENLAYGNLLAFLEVTRGAKEMCSASINPLYLLPAICSSVSFGGLSIIFQSYSYLEKCDVTFGSFFIVKATQAILAYCICFLACLIYFKA